jgi:hypothetical protein
MSDMTKLKKTRSLTAAELDRIRGGGELATAGDGDDTAEARPARNALAIMTLSAGVP